MSLSQGALRAGQSVVLWSALCLGGWATANAQPAVQVQNVLQLSASGSVEVTQDLLHVTVSTTEEGSSAAEVQQKLQKAADAALAVIKPSIQPGALEVETSQFSVYPRTSGKDGKIGGWQGQAQLLLYGKDFDRITQTAAKVQVMQVSQVNFGLTRAAREKVEADAQQKAIDAFKRKAEALAKGFGFTSYSLREVAVNSQQSGGRPVMMRASKTASFDSSESGRIPVEAGKTVVEVQVNGSVQLK